MDKIQFGRLLISLRKQRGMSQREMAGRLAVSASAVSKWEHGSNLPDMVMLNRIAELLAVSCDDLMNPKRTLERMEGLPLESLSVGERIVEDSVSEDGAMTGEKHAVKGWRKLALVAAALILLGAVGGGMLILYPFHETSGNFDFCVVDIRYVQDAYYGKMFEIACTTNEVVDRAAMDLYMENLRGIYIQGKTVDEDTEGVRIFYYENESDAAAWMPTEKCSAFFF